MLLAGAAWRYFGGIPLTTVRNSGELFGSLGRELPGGVFSSF